MELLEIEVLPLQPSQFASSESGWHVEKQHGLLPDTKSRKKQLHLLDFENVRCMFSFCGNSHSLTLCRTSDGVPVGQFPPDRMVEDTAHRVANLLPRSAGKRFRLAELGCDKRLEPLLNRDGLDGPQLHLSPVGNNPPAQKVRLPRAGRVGFAFRATVRKFVDGVMIHCLRHGDRSQLRWPISVNGYSQSGHCLVQFPAFCRIFFNCSDDLVSLPQRSVTTTLAPAKEPSFPSVLSPNCRETAISETCQHSYPP